jgi:tRNA (mo5U34)-methyltransferase
MSRAMPSGNRSLQAQIEALGPWFHNLHLPDGTQTAPEHFLGDFPSFKWAKVANTVPADLTGWTVLDIGCNAGFYSVELARRGAQVTAFDIEPLYLDQARWVAKQFGVEERVHLSLGHVYDLIHERRTFDLVWFTGVFYHLRYPVLALDLVRAVTAKRLMFQTLTMPGTAVATPPEDMHIDHREEMLADGWPKMSYIEKRLAGDESNWWAPNHACVEALLRTAGFRVLERPDHEFYFCEVTDVRDPRAAAEFEDIRRIAARRPD